MTVMETDNGLCLTVVIVLLQLCTPTGSKHSFTRGTRQQKPSQERKSNSVIE